jgi:hypothetical protein
MTHKKHNDEVIKNEDTLVRRAWIESAIQGVRSRMGDMPAAEDSSLYESETVEFEPHPREDMDSSGAHLVLAWDANARRSGT